MRFRLGAVILALATATACGPSEGSFLEDYSRAACQVAEECDPEFDAVYADIDACVEDLLGFVNETTFEECTFDKGAAGDCLGEVRGASCAEYESGTSFMSCEDVYTECPNE